MRISSCPHCTSYQNHDPNHLNPWTWSRPTTWRWTYHHPCLRLGVDHGARLVGAHPRLGNRDLQHDPCVRRNTDDTPNLEVALRITHLPPSLVGNPEETVTSLPTPPGYRPLGFVAAAGALLVEPLPDCMILTAGD